MTRTLRLFLLALLVWSPSRNAEAQTWDSVLATRRRPARILGDGWHDPAQWRVTPNGTVPRYPSPGSALANRAGRGT